MTTTLAKTEPGSPLEVLEGLGSFVRLSARSAGPVLFRKEVARVGRWVHPNTGAPVEITRSYLEALVANTTRFLELGHKIGAPDGHTESAAKNYGWWLGFTLEGDKLFGILELENHEVAAKVGREIRDVSIFARPWTASDGTPLDPVLLHVCLTCNPVIPGQDNFVRLAASQEIPMSTPNAGAVAAPPKHEEKKLATDGLLLAAVKKLCGLPPEADEAAAVAALEAWSADETGADTEVAMAAKSKIETLEKQIVEIKAAAEKQSAALRLEAAQREVEAERVKALAAGLPLDADTIALATESLSSPSESEKRRGRHMLKLALSAKTISGTKVEPASSVEAKEAAAKRQAAINGITRTAKKGD